MRDETVTTRRTEEAETRDEHSGEIDAALLAYWGRRNRSRCGDAPWTRQQVEAMRAALTAADREAVTLGDRMQSEGSRMAEFIASLEAAPYEVRMAAAQFRSDVDAWTTLRTGER